MPTQAASPSAPYSPREHLRYLGLIFTSPSELMRRFTGAPSPWYGASAFLFYTALSLGGLLIATSMGNTQTVSPLPKLLPIPDDKYLLYQATFGPLIKLACIFVFGGVLWCLARLFKAIDVPVRATTVFFVFVGNSIGLVAFIVDQIVIWTALPAPARIALSTIHPLALIIDTAYLVAYLHHYSRTSVGLATALVLPSIILAGPIPGVLFR